MENHIDAQSIVRLTFNPRYRIHCIWEPAIKEVTRKNFWGKINVIHRARNGGWRLNSWGGHSFEDVLKQNYVYICVDGFLIHKETPENNILRYSKDTNGYWEAMASVTVELNSKSSVTKTFITNEKALGWIEETKRSTGKDFVVIKH